MSGIGPTTAKYALVAAGAFVLVIGVGLFSVMRNDERRLAQLEAELQTRQAPPTQVSTSSSGDASRSPSAADEPALPAPAGDQSSNQLALGGVTVPPADASAPATDQPLPPSPAASPSTGQQEMSGSSEAPSTADTEGVEPPAPADGWLHASQLAAEDIDAPSTPSWFASINSSESAEAAAPVCSADRSLRTALVWAKSPQEAAEQARREGKLVFIIHVSGNFEDPGFT